jgi:alpha/beta superfamily hydrolase
MIKQQKQLTLQGPAGNLEALITTPENTPSKTVAIICHPHPLHGGAMGNKVVTTLAKTFHELQHHTIRFNFRGVGKSEGHYAEAIGEVDDLLAVLNWARQTYPDYKIWLAGFSFGSHIAAQVAAKDDDIQQLISIAPPVNHFNFQNTDSVTCPWLVVMGEQDEVVPVEDVRAWLNKAEVPIKSVFLPDVTHFFHGKLNLLRDVVKTGVAELRSA